MIYCFLAQSPKDTLQSIVSVIWSGGGGQALSLVGQEYTQLGAWTAIYRHTSPAAATGGTVTVTYANSNATWDGGVANCYALSGVNITTPNDNYTSGVGTNDTPTANIVSDLGDLILDTAIGQKLAITANGSQTEQWNVNPGSAGAGSSKTGAASQTTMTWTLGAPTSGKWSLSGISINPVDPLIVISGTLFSDEGKTSITAGKTIKMYAATSSQSIASSTISNGSGVFTFAGVQGLNLGTPVSVWVDGDAPATYAYTLTKASSTSNNISELNLYQNRAMVKYEAEDATTTTIADLSVYDGDDDSDIQFLANNGTLEVMAGQMLYIAPGTEFAPGGTATSTLHGGNAQNGIDGDIKLAYGARQDGVSTSSILSITKPLSIGGSWFASTTAIFNPGTATTTFTATTTGKSLYASSTNFYAIDFDGVNNGGGGAAGGGWTFQENASTTNHFIINTGTVIAPSSGALQIGGNYKNGGIFTHNNATTTFTGASAKMYYLQGTMTGSSAFHNFEWDGSSVASTTFLSNASTTNYLITSGTTTAPALLSVAGNYQNNGGFDANSGTTTFNGTNAQNIGGNITQNWASTAGGAALTGVIVAWPSTAASIPDGWTRVTDLDTYFIEATTTNANIGVAMGDSTHTHTSPTHTHSIAHSSSGHTSGASGSAVNVYEDGFCNDEAELGGHAHPFNLSANAGSNNSQSANLGTAPNDPPYTKVIFIKGTTATDIPNGAWALFNSDTLPTNWTRVNGNRFLKGADSSGNGGGTGGSSDSHTHTDSGHQHTESSHTHTTAQSSSATRDCFTSTGAGTVAGQDHLHVLSGGSQTATESSDAAANPANADGRPPFYKLNTIQNDTGSDDSPIGTIAMWDGAPGSIPSGWELCDGSGGCPNLAPGLGGSDSSGYFILGANADAEIGTTGGALTHSHGVSATHTHTINSHTHTYTDGGPDHTDVATGDVDVSIATFNHTHSWSASHSGTTGTATITASANNPDTQGGNRPPYKGLMFIRLTSLQSGNSNLEGSPFNAIEITNITASTTFLGAASTTATFTAELAGARIEFAAGATTTAQNINIAGASGNEVYLHSNTDDTSWNFGVPGDRSVDYANIKDSNACYVTGNDITASNSTDGGNNFCWSIPGAATSLTLSNHTLGLPESDKFNTSSITDSELFRFKMTPSGTVATTLQFRLGVLGIETGDITNVQLFPDYDSSGNKDNDDPEDELGGGGTVSITGNSGTITFSSFSTSTARDYIMEADVANIRPGNQLTISLLNSDITTDATTVSGIVVKSIHTRSGGGVGGGFSAPGPSTGTATEGGAGGQGKTLSAEQGYNKPTAVGTPSNFWTSGSNGIVSDGSYASVTSDDYGINFNNFGFNIPSNAIIDGIEVRIESSCVTTCGTIDVALTWDNSGTNATTTAKNSGTLTTTDDIYTFGGGANTWTGHSWVPGDFTNVNFSVEVSANPSGANAIRIDSIDVKVYR